MGRSVRFGMLFALLLVIVAAGMTASTQNTPRESLFEGVATGKTRVLDLSYAINEKLVPWPGDEKTFEAKVNGTVEKDGYFTRSFWMLEHYGTHLDAPIHFPPGTMTVDQIPAARLFGPAVVIDVREESAKDADYRLSTEKLESWEKQHGEIPEHSIVLLRTGWASRWPDVKRYRNQDAQGKMHFPGYSAEAARVLVARRVNGLGCDTLSIDYGESNDFPVHRVILGAGLYQLENLSSLVELPETGAFLVVAPIKLEGGSGGPARVFALLRQ